MSYYNTGDTPRMWRALAKVLWWRILVHGILSFLLVSVRSLVNYVNYVMFNFSVRLCCLLLRVLY